MGAERAEPGRLSRVEEGGREFSKEENQIANRQESGRKSTFLLLF
jgi:hypothetical protein